MSYGLDNMIPYTCPKCKTPIGVIVEQHGQLWLNSGGWLLAEARKHCHVCGNAVYFKRPKKTMNEVGSFSGVPIVVSDTVPENEVWVTNGKEKVTIKGVR